MIKKKKKKKKKKKEGIWEKGQIDYIKRWLYNWYYYNFLY